MNSWVNDDCPQTSGFSQNLYRGKSTLGQKQVFIGSVILALEKKRGVAWTNLWDNLSDSKVDAVVIATETRGMGLAPMESRPGMAVPRT